MERILVSRAGAARIGMVPIILALIALALTSPAQAQSPLPSDDEVNAIAKQLYCPVCENVPLDVCPTEACRQWRELIRLQLSEGKTEDEIKQYFALHYGGRVLAEPPPTGINWFLYLLPVAVILGAGGLLLIALIAWTRLTASSTVKTQGHNGPADAYVTEVEEELKRRA